MAPFSVLTRANAFYQDRLGCEAFTAAAQNIADTLSLSLILFTTDRKRR
jgi:hypothetical protein